MTEQDLRIALVIATKDRPHDLGNILKNLSEQTRLPDQVVVVDASRVPVKPVTDAFRSIKIKYIYHAKPSAAAQRNIGIDAVDSDIDLIGFLDDDVILEKQALRVMMEFWKAAPDNIGGGAFNFMNPLPTDGVKLKKTAFVNWLGIYSSRRGAVMLSGWQTLIGTVNDTIFVDWLPSGASIWRREIFDRFSFDLFFDGYSYLEDLDFSFSVRKQYQLAVVVGAGFFHYHSESGRISFYRFGKIEVRNRLYFVRKHGLSKGRCYLGLFIRLILTLYSFVKEREKIYLLRAFGNSVAIAESLIRQAPCFSGNYTSDRNQIDEKQLCPDDSCL
jgi:glycosyltransferase involved in cell wall biosynthesis